MFRQKPYIDTILTLLLILCCVSCARTNPVSENEPDAWYVVLRGELNKEIQTNYVIGWRIELPEGSLCIVSIVVYAFENVQGYEPIWTIPPENLDAVYIWDDAGIRNGSRYEIVVIVIKGG